MFTLIFLLKLTKKRTSTLCTLFIVMSFMTSPVLADDLIARNPYNIVNHVESEHFVVYWGEGISASDVQPLLDYLEVNWRFIIEEKKFERPPTTQIYKENIYISGTGQPLHDDELSAIQGLDVNGHEHIIMHKDSLFDQQRLEVTVVHEFFHTIQSAYKVPELSPRLWVGEATATWAAFMSLPDSVVNLARNALTQYAFYPQYSLDVVLGSQPSEYYLLEGHHYGAFIFFVHLTEYFNDQDLVLKLLEYVKNEISSRNNKQAIDLLDDFLLETYGGNLREAFHQFAARNAIWDYPEQQAYLAAIEIQDNGTNNEHTAAVKTTLESKWQTVDSKYLPHRWGASYVKLMPINQQSLEVGFEGNSLGSSGSQANWQVSIVIENQNGYEYIELPLSDNKLNSYTIETTGDEKIWLAASVSSAVINYNEAFAYRYQFAESGKSEPSPNSEVEYVVEIPKPIESGGGSGGSLNFIFLWFCGLLILRDKLNVKKLSFIVE